MRQMRSFSSKLAVVRVQRRTVRRSRHFVVALFLLSLLFAALPSLAAPPQAPSKAHPTRSTAPQAPAKTHSTRSNEAQPNWADELNKYPGLLEEYGRLLTRFQQEIKFPASRKQSHLLQLMPQSTTAYGAFPNYGAAVHQALDIFHEELKSSTPLRNWWRDTQAKSKAPDFETMLKRYYEISEYLGDEIVASALVKQDGGALLLAEVKKPGAEEFLRGVVKELGKEHPPQVLNLKELATAQDPNGKPVILVRPDLVIFSTDLKTAREFNSKLGSGQPSLETTEFGRRLSESYGRGVDMLLAADVQSMLGQMPKGRPEDQRLLQQSGFANAKYAIWEYADVTGQPSSQSELSFTGPRRGIASWLAAPGHLAGLDYVSSDAVMAFSVLLKNPAEIFADLKELTATPNPDGPQKLASMEPMVMPILSQLTGDITLELDPAAATAGTPTMPEWKVILGTRDTDALRQALSPILASVQPREITKGGDTYYLVQAPNGSRPMEISYSFQKGYLVLGSSQQVVEKALGLRRSGQSLAKSERYRSALPSGHSAEASAVMYQNSIGYMNAMLSKLPAEFSRGWLQAAGERSSVINAFYGQETAIYQASNSGTASVAPVLIVAAVAIPNLLRARIAANEASAVGSIRAMNTAQVTYASTYPERGYARDLASLGESPRAPSASRAGLLDSVLGCPGGTAGNWCIKSGYKFTLYGGCVERRCDQYVTAATPVSTSTGMRSFCSTSDGVIRFRVGPPLTAAVSASECSSWQALR